MIRLTKARKSLRRHSETGMTVAVIRMAPRMQSAEVELLACCTANKMLMVKDYPDLQQIECRNS